MPQVIRSIEISGTEQSLALVSYTGSTASLD